MEFSEYLFGGIYLSACRFANIERFTSYVTNLMGPDAHADSPATASHILREAAGHLDSAAESVVSTEEDAERRLIARDLRLVAESELALVDEFASVEARLDHFGPHIQSVLVDLGLDVRDAPLRIVDVFPEPFHRFAWSAFAPDLEDEENFGIPRGVYFRRDKLRPFYSEALFAHEVVHTVTGRIDPDIYAMGLEEGIAEVLGTCFAGNSMLSEKVLANILIHGRHGIERPKLWSVYLNHTRQASLLYDRFGLEGLAELIRRGRKAIHDAEHAVLTGQVEQLDLPRGKTDPKTSRVLDFACRGYLSTHVFSPLECLLLLSVRKGLTMDQICEGAGVDPTVGGPVLERLGAESALFVQDGDRIAYSNVERYLHAEEESVAAIIRYLPR
ncbi:hypothetical protein ACFXMT_19380 [Streptomyces mirabilis]|uniref:hypothetical protein n=1 Tax=Streptomyces TaxID=1883 RepID=UPI0011627319|nr:MULTISPECIES: hypothetical protein [unclassified Streptomyces]QDN97721.1 hypothetical protein FNV58_18415 [Streptomyces sp. RLB1-9]QDO19428.1 hypothetical protein FNV65_16865 [Streptomyces sp. S1A1-8]QDO29554.1 hypothetical protein FNV63_16880 [Streptomyces sp. S1A1-3]